MNAPRPILQSIEAEYQRYKLLAERAMEQLTEEQLCRGAGAGAGDNSIAALVWHLSGNFESRFTDFLESDGEKPWRDRESEFQHRTVSREALREKWERGWSALTRSLADLEDGRLHELVRIRGVQLSVLGALHRSLAHASYHVGQIVLLAKAARGDQWQYLSIPPGGSAITIVEERPDAADAHQLLAELDADLQRHPYPPESRHAFSVDQLVREGVAFFVVRYEGKPAACGGVKLFGTEYGEVKRMYVRPAYRGLGLGKAVLHHLAEYARARHVGVLRLETGIYQPEAIGLYERYGFQRRPPFGEYKVDLNSVYFEKLIA